MPIFTRRRLQEMLQEIRPFLPHENKYRDLVARLDSNRHDQALPAEAELSLLWALSKVGHLEVEPKWFSGSALPDAYTDSLFMGDRGAVVEIAGLGDGVLSGEDLMRAASTKIRTFVNSIIRGAGEHLYFKFHEEMGNEHGKYFRRRRIKQEFGVNEVIERKLMEWTEGNFEKEIRIANEYIDVSISYQKSRPNKFYNFFSYMPPVADTLDKNPLFESLERKRKQLRGTTKIEHRVIFLADAGSTLLRDIGKMNVGFGSVSGDQIIRHFLSQSGDIDLICVFTPRRSRPQFLTGQRSVDWHVSSFLNKNCQSRINTASINKIRELLPKPRLEGYQAKELHFQRLFHPKARGWYLGLEFTSGNRGDFMKLSSRALTDLLAGRISLQEFNLLTGLAQAKSEENIFENYLTQGMIVKSISFEMGGLDEDDDYVVFHFDHDPSASRFK